MRSFVAVSGFLRCVIIKKYSKDHRILYVPGNIHTTDYSCSEETKSTHLDVVIWHRLIFPYEDTQSHEFTSPKSEISRNSNKVFDVFLTNFDGPMCDRVVVNIAERMTIARMASRGVICPILFFLFKPKRYPTRMVWVFFYKNKFNLQRFKIRFSFWDTLYLRRNEADAKEGVFSYKK